MANLPCLTLFRRGMDTTEIARTLGLKDEWRAYNRLAAERDFEARQRREEKRGLLSPDARGWAASNAAKLRAAAEGAP